MTGTDRTRQRKKRPSGSGAIVCHELLGRSEWQPLPAVVILAGDAEFFRKQIECRILRELFGEEPNPAVTRLSAAKPAPDLLATVLDELQTVSLFSSHRLVVVEEGDAFISDHRKELEPYVRSGFSGGHLVLHTSRIPDGRWGFTVAARESGWIVECRQPFDRPPPWETGAPPWQNELSQWIVTWAKKRKLRISLQDAHRLQERVGTDLTRLDSSLEKIRVFLGAKSDTVDATTIDSVTGILRDDSVFDLVDRFIEGDRGGALGIAERLFRVGYRPAGGSPIFEPASIVLLFVGATISRLRALRQAHEISAAGGGPQQWLDLRLTTRPFIDRFRRQLDAMPPKRLEAILDLLLRVDRQLKTGADAKTVMGIVLARG